MNKLSLLLLTVFWAIPVHAQEAPSPGVVDKSMSPETVGASAGVAATAASPDSVSDAESVGKRAVAGAVAGAVTGAILAAEDASCAPAANPAKASFLGGMWGALRGVLGLRAQEPTGIPGTAGRPAPGRGGPFPFENEECDRT